MRSIRLGGNGGKNGEKNVEGKETWDRHPGRNIGSGAFDYCLRACAPAPALPAERTVEIGVLACLTGAGATARLCGCTNRYSVQ
jgi:hypothetical protein